MQDNSLDNIKQLPSHYTLGEYERIFFPKWLYKFWPYQQIFMWSLFFISLIVYLLILGLVSGYKLNIKIFNKRQEIKNDIKDISNIAQVYPVGGIIIKTNDKNSIITLHNLNNNIKIKNNKFISLPVGVYDMNLFSTNKFPINGKLVIGKELVYKSYFYLFNKKAKLLTIFALNSAKRNVLNSYKLQLNNNIFISRQNNQDAFAFILNNKGSYFLIKIKYSTLLNKAFESYLNITSVIAKCKQIDPQFNLQKFYYWRQNLLFLNNKKIIVINLSTQKVYFINKKESSFDLNYVFINNYIYIFKNFGNKIVMVANDGKIFQKNYKQKGWFNIFNNTLYFWDIKDMTNHGIVFNIYKIGKNLELNFVRNLFIPVNNISQIGFWNSELIYLIQNNKFILYPLTDATSTELSKFMMEEPNKLFFSNFLSINSSYNKFMLGSYRYNNAYRFFVYAYLPVNMMLNQSNRQENCSMLTNTKISNNGQDNQALVCFSDDFIIHAQRPNGVYYLDKEGVKFLDSYNNVVLFTKQDNKNIYLFAKYLFINSPDIKVDSFERKNYTILGVYKGILVVLNKQKYVLQIFKL